MMKWIKRLLWFGLVIYILGCSALYFMQDSLIFDPHQIHESHKFRQGEEIELEVDDGVYLNMLHQKRRNPKGVVIYLHGNRGDIRRCLHQANSFIPSNYDFILPDYRGYGKSDGKIFSQRQMYEDVQHVYDYAKKQYAEKDIIVTGYSLGSGMASYLAANNDPSKLVLVAPFVSINNLKNRYAWFIPDFLVKYPLNNYKHLQQIKCPATIFHGTADRVIPYDSSEKLEKVEGDITLVTLNNTSHRKAIFHDKLRRWFSNL